MNREKELLLRMTGTIVTIVLCLAAMGFSAFAYFSHSISSGVNVIQSAHFDVVVTLLEEKSDTVEQDDEATGESSDESAVIGKLSDEGAGGKNGASLAGNRLDGCGAKIYTFQIEASGDAQTGYCKIVIGRPGADQQVYYTTQLYLQPNEGEGQRNALIIDIDMTKADGYTIEFIPQWGTSGLYAVEEESLLNDKDKISFEPAVSTDEEMSGSHEGAVGDGDGSQIESGTETGAEPGVKEYYTVVGGDTLYGIATRHGLSTDELYEFNKSEIANPDSLVIGQVLKIPISKSGEESESEAENMAEPTTESETKIAMEPAGEVAS